jgi:hypothetical protein
MCADCGAVRDGGAAAASRARVDVGSRVRAPFPSHALNRVAKRAGVKPRLLSGNVLVQIAFAFAVVARITGAARDAGIAARVACSGEDVRAGTRWCAAEAKEVE